MKKNFNKKKKIIFLFLLVVLVAYKPIITFALGVDDCARILYDYKDYFVQNSIIQDAVRFLEWSLLKGLRFLAENSQNLYRNTLGLIDFTQYESLNKWINTFEGVFNAILALSIMWFGITLIVNHKKRPEILTSIMLAALTISALSSIMITANKSVAAFCNELASTSVADDIVNNNFYDLMYIDYKYGLGSFSDDLESLAKYHYDLEDFDINSIDFNEVINYENPRLSTDGKELLSKKFTYYSRKDYVCETVYNGWGWNSGDDDDLFNEFYYRYKVNAFTVDISLIAVIIVYLCVSYKTCRLIYELAIKKILAILYSADITGTQKTLKVLGSIKDSYIILALTAIILKVFQLMQNFLQEKFSNNGFTFCILLLFTAFAAIDGPNIIQALTGEDAGLQSGYTRIMAAYNGGKGMKDRAVGHVGSAVQTGIGEYRYRKIKNAMNGQNSKSAKNANFNSASGINTSGQDANKDMKNALKNDTDSAAEKKTDGNSDNTGMKEGVGSNSIGKDANKEMKDSLKNNNSSVSEKKNGDKSNNIAEKDNLFTSSNGKDANKEMQDSIKNNAGADQEAKDSRRSEKGETKNNFANASSGKDANNDMKNNKNLSDSTGFGNIDDSAGHLNSALNSDGTDSPNEDIRKDLASGNHASAINAKTVNDTMKKAGTHPRGSLDNYNKSGKKNSASAQNKGKTGEKKISAGIIRKEQDNKKLNMESRINREDNLK